jgi:hypothetical protein
LIYISKSIINCTEKIISHHFLLQREIFLIPLS